MPQNEGAHRLEHERWLAAMDALRVAIAACPHDWSDARTTVNDIPRGQFGEFEECLRDWAFSYVQLAESTGNAPEWRR